MIFTNTKESGFETLIVKWLVEHNGYEEGSNTRTILLSENGLQT